MKPYTKLRQVYAWIGFIHLLIYACLGIYFLTGIETTPNQDPEPNMPIITPVITQVTQESIEIIEVIEKPQEVIQPSKSIEKPTVFIEKPTQRVIAYKAPQQQSIEQEHTNDDNEWQSLCNDLQDLTGANIDNYPRAKQSYRACADTFIGIAQNMANGGLAGAEFTATLSDLSTEYQSLL